MANSKSLFDRTSDTLRRLGIGAKDSVLVAVSGGIDSSALLHVLVTLRETGHIGAVHTAHINHGLRGEASDADERLVRHMCENANVPMVVRSVDTEKHAHTLKCGIEEAARELRYTAFKEIAVALGVRFVLTAHSANDQAETVMMNIMRGAGVRGLSGIPETRTDGAVTFVRPWLDVTRKEIAEYAADRALHFAEDATNTLLDYQRNRVRHIVIPAIAQAFDTRDILASFEGLARRMAGLQRYIEREASVHLAAAKTDRGLRLERLDSLPSEILAEVVEHWLAAQDKVHRLNSSDRESIAVIVQKGSGAIELSKGVRLLAAKGLLSIAGPRSEFEPVDLSRSMKHDFPQGVLCVGPPARLRLDAAHFYIATEDVHRFQLRPWQATDKMEPFGMQGRSKLISDLLTDAGVTGEQRTAYPVLEDIPSSTILWLPGIRGSELSRKDGAAACSGLVELEWLPVDEE
jgi:tRNA(Ile)-lysidine synthase